MWPSFAGWSIDWKRRSATMTDVLLRMLCGATLGLVLALLLRRPARRMFGAGPAFTLWLLPVALALAPLLPREWAPAAMVVLPGLTVTPHVATNTTAATTIDWAQGLMVLWLLGAAIGLLRLALHYSRLRRGTLPVPAEWSRWLTQCVPGLDPRRLRLHPAGPAVLWALPRSLILLPADFADRFGNAATRELVLRHELTHARRGDALWSLAMEIASALLWFHPLVWIARPRFRLDQELACDAASLRALPQRVANYARALLDSVAVRPVPALIPWLAEPQLKERIAMITRIPPGALRRRAGFAAVTALLAGGLFVAGGAVAGRAASAASATSSPSSDVSNASNAHISFRAPTPGTSSAFPPTVDVTYKNRNPPAYPAEAIKKGEQGKVLLDVTIDATGKVTKATVDPKRSTAPVALQNAALLAAINWRFNPGMEHGHPVGGRVEIPVTFSLDVGHRKSPNNSLLCSDGYRHEQVGSNSYTCTAESPVSASS
jgi:TonB family protein